MEKKKHKVKKTTNYYYLQLVSQRANITNTYRTLGNRGIKYQNSNRKMGKTHEQTT